MNRLVTDYNEDVRTRDSELSAAREANSSLQSKLDELSEQNRILESDALAAKRSERRVMKLESKRAKDKDEIALLKSQLSSANDLQDARVREAREEMARGFRAQVSEAAGILAEIGGKAKVNMLDLSEIDANLELIELLQGSAPPDLGEEVKNLRRRQAPIYDARDAFDDLLTAMKKILTVPDVSAAIGVERVDAEEEDGEESDVEIHA